MKDCEAVFKLNDSLFKQGEKYISIGEEDISNDWSLETMMSLSEREIFVDGFVSSNKNYIGAVWCGNKEVYNIADIDNNAFICTEKNIYTINADLRNKIVIYGAGLNGRRIAEILEMRGWEIECFVDSQAEELEDKELIKKRIHNVKFLENLDETYSVVLAGVAWKEMLANVTKLNSKVNVFWFEQDSLCGRLVCIPYIFWNFDKLAKNKKVYVYGDNDNTKSFVKLIKCMGYLFGGILTDKGDEEKSIESIEDILYKSDFLIVADNAGKEKDYEKLTNLGLKYPDEFTFGGSFDTSSSYIRGLILDVNLGYTYINKGIEFPGFDIYGENRNGDIIVLTLGGSTTDSTFYPFKSWPELLYEKWPDRKITVYNGGVAGYNSGQELFKLLRDGLILKPDMIIEYGAYNDIAFADAHEPYAFEYMKYVFEYANKHFDRKWNLQSPLGRTVSTGIKWDKETAEMWLENIMIMHTVSKLKGIQFYSFIQPDIYTKKNKNAHEKGIWLNNEWDMDKKRTKMMQYIRDNFITQKYDYIYDLTGLFDGQTDIYIDPVHVYEKGNEMVADAILKIIEKKSVSGKETNICMIKE